MKTRLILALMLTLLTLGALPARSVDIISQPEYSFLWNRFNAVEVIGKYALVTTDFGLAVLELDSASGVFTQVNQLLLENQATELSVAANLATVSTSAGLLYFVDIVNLPELTLTGQTDLGASVYDALLVEDNLYLACGFQGLRHFKIEPGGDVQFVDSSLAPIHCIQVEAQGDYLVVLDDYNGLIRYLLSASGTPEIESRIMVPRRVQAFFGTEDTLVLALVDVQRVYRATFDNGGELTDSAEFSIVPQIVFQIDSFLVAVNAYQGRLEMMSTLNGRRVGVTLATPLGLHPVGDTFYHQGSAWLMLSSDSYGLAGFDLKRLQDVRDPRQVLSHPGPINALTLVKDRVLTGGTRSPLESYRLASPLHAELDTALFTHIDVDAMTSSGDLAFVHMNPTNRLQSFRMAGDSMVAVSSVVTRTDPYHGMKYFDNLRSDTLGLLIVIGTRWVDLVTVSPAGELRLSSHSIDVPETISDAIVLDSFLLVSTVNQQIYSYLIYSSFTAAYWYSGATPGSFDHMTFTGPRHAPDGTFMDGIALAVDGNQMYQILLTIKGFPWTRPAGSLPVEVVSSACTPDALYGVGPQGTVIVDIRRTTPTVLAYGGLGGSLIAVHDSIMAVSDGTALHLYVYRNDTFIPTDDSKAIAKESFLRPNYPNPFNPRTRIDFMVPEAGKVEIAVFDILGRRVTTLIESELTAGPHSVEWSGTDHSGNRVASGIYFYRMTTPRTTETRKMVLLK